MMKVICYCQSSSCFLLCNSIFFFPVRTNKIKVQISPRSHSYVRDSADVSFYALFLLLKKVFFPHLRWHLVHLVFVRIIAHQWPPTQLFAFSDATPCFHAYCRAPLSLPRWILRIVCLRTSVANSSSDWCLENGGYQDVFQTNKDVFFHSLGNTFQAAQKYVGQNSAWKPSGSGQCKSTIMVQCSDAEMFSVII